MADQYSKQLANKILTGEIQAPSICQSEMPSELQQILLPSHGSYMGTITIKHGIYLQFNTICSYQSDLS